MTRLQQRFASALFGVGIAVVAAGLMAAHAGARQPAPKGAEITALAFDSASRRLLKATAGALYRSVDEGRDWTRLPLPPAASRGRIAAVAVSAHDKGVLYLAGPGIGVLRSGDGGQIGRAHV